jgi:hypothetical protein
MRFKLTVATMNEYSFKRISRTRYGMRYEYVENAFKLSVSSCALTKNGKEKEESSAWRREHLSFRNGHFGSFGTFFRHSDIANATWLVGRFTTKVIRVSHFDVVHRVASKMECCSLILTSVKDYYPIKYNNGRLSCC